MDPFRKLVEAEGCAVDGAAAVANPFMRAADALLSRVVVGANRAGGAAQPAAADQPGMVFVPRAAVAAPSPPPPTRTAQQQELERAWIAAGAGPALSPSTATVRAQVPQPHLLHAHQPPAPPAPSTAPAAAATAAAAQHRVLSPWFAPQLHAYPNLPLGVARPEVPGMQQYGYYQQQQVHQYYPALHQQPAQVTGYHGHPTFAAHRNVPYGQLGAGGQALPAGFEYNAAAPHAQMYQHHQYQQGLRVDTKLGPPPMNRSPAALSTASSSIHAAGIGDGRTTVDENSDDVGRSKSRGAHAAADAGARDTVKSDADDDVELQANARSVADSLSAMAAADERYANSAFLQFMRGIADGTTRVRGDVVVDEDASLGEARVTAAAADGPASVGDHRNAAREQPTLNAAALQAATARLPPPPPGVHDPLASYHYQDGLDSIDARELPALDHLDGEGDENRGSCVRADADATAAASNAAAARAAPHAAAGGGGGSSSEDHVGGLTFDDYDSRYDGAGGAKIQQGAAAEVDHADGDAEEEAVGEVRRRLAAMEEAWRRAVSGEAHVQFDSDDALNGNGGSVLDAVMQHAIGAVRAGQVGGLTGEQMGRIANATANGPAAAGAGPDGRSTGAHAAVNVTDRFDALWQQHQRQDRHREGGTAAHQRDADFESQLQAVIDRAWVEEGGGAGLDDADGKEGGGRAFDDAADGDSEHDHAWWDAAYNTHRDADAPGGATGTGAGAGREGDGDGAARMVEYVLGPWHQNQFLAHRGAGDRLAQNHDGDACLEQQQLQAQEPGELFNIGMRLFNEGRLQEAIMAFEAVLHLTGVAAEGDALETAGPSGTADQRQLHYHSEAWRMLGACHAENDDDRSSIACLQRAVDCDPYNTSALLQLTVSYVNEAQHSRALETLRAWIAHHPRCHPLAIRVSNHNGIPSHQRMTGSGNAAAAAGAGGVSATGSLAAADAAAEAASLYNDGSALDEVMEILLQADAFMSQAGGGGDGTDGTPGHESQFTTDPDIAILLGVLYNVSRDFDSAAGAFQRALNMSSALAPSPDSGPASSSLSNRRSDLHDLWNKLGASLAHQGDHERALQAYDRSLALKPAFARGWLNVGISHFSRERYGDAARAYLRALRLQYQRSSPLGLAAGTAAVGYAPSTAAGIAGAGAHPTVGGSVAHMWTLLRIAFSAMDRFDLVAKTEACNPSVFDDAAF